MTSNYRLKWNQTYSDFNIQQKEERKVERKQTVQIFVHLYGEVWRDSCEDGERKGRQERDLFP